MIPAFPRYQCFSATCFECRNIAGSYFKNKKKKQILLTSLQNLTAEVTGGRNGYGAKLTNIFSTKFTLETADAKSGKKFRQTMRNNMTVKEEPRILDFNGGVSGTYTQVSFKPDLEKFGMTELTDDIIALMRKRVRKSNQ